MKFKPVHLPADRRLNGRASQTMLRHYDRCPRSGYLYALYKGEAQTLEMVRGSALHAVLERATRAALEQGEGYIPGDVVKVIVDEVLAEYHVPFEEHDYVRECAYRWAGEFVCKPGEVIAVETLIVLQLDGWDVRMKVDYAELLERGGACHVVDYKSSRSMPSQEDVARKRPSPLNASEAGALLAKNFQLVLYALGLAFGTPVRIEMCDSCDGTGRFYHPEIEEPGDPACAMCDGRGTIETPEPFPLAGQAQRFDLEFVFPGIENRTEGTMARRSMSLTRVELSEYMESLRGLLTRLARSEETGDWPAQVSDDACTECPARTLCPIPVELRDHRGTINTEEEAREAEEKLDRVRAESNAISREIKSFCKAHNIDLRFGKDKVREWTATETEKIVDREGMFLAVQRAAEFGEPFERGKYVKTVRGTGFSVRTLTADELAAEAAERNGNA
jgi:hypothetical protein